MGAIIDANHRGGCRDDEFSHNLEWGTLMQIVSPNFQKLPLGIHQNTPFKAKKFQFFPLRRGLPHTLPRRTPILNPTKPSPKIPARFMSVAAIADRPHLTTSNEASADVFYFYQSQTRLALQPTPLCTYNVLFTRH